MKTTKKLALMLTALLMLAACGDDDGDVIVSPGNKPSGGATAVNTNQNTTGPSEARYRLEFPKLKGGDNIVVIHRAIMNKNTKTEGVNYCIEWSPSINAQRWSCYQMYSSVNYNTGDNVSRYYATNDGSLSASCQYPNDPDLPAAYQMTYDPYKNQGLGFDHGHICPSADRLRTTEANYQTFFITNMQPQYSNFNGSNNSSSVNERSPWYRLETQVRTWAGATYSDTLFVVKGGTIDKSEHILRYLKDTRYGTNTIPVPKYFFVALLSKKGGNYKAIGFWMEHLSSYADKKTLSYYAYSIDQLEQFTGIDFFCNLPDDTENEVEKGYVASEWGGLQ